MLNRITTLSAIFVLTSCATDVIDHGGGNGGVGTRDAGPTFTRDGGPMNQASNCQLAAIPPIHFGIVPLASPSTLNVSVQNEGADPCVFADFMTLPTATDFTTNVPGSRPVTLAPGASMVAPVTFQASAVGVAEATLRLALTDGFNIDIALYGVVLREEIAAQQTVTFQVRNTSSQDLYLVTEGWSCDPYDVGLDLSLGFQCICECPPPPSPKAVTFRRIAAGAQYDVTWDARELSTLRYEFDCGARGWEGLVAEVTAGSMQPAPAGTYDVTFAFEDTMPADCWVDGDFVRCDMSSGSFPGEAPTPIATICPAENYTMPVSFAVPATGDIVVPVAITNSP